MPGPERIATLILRLVAPLLVLPALFALPGYDTSAAAATGEPVSRSELQSSVDMAYEPGIYQVRDGGSVPLNCQTCSPSDPLSHHAPRARFSAPSERFASLPPGSRLMYFDHGHAAVVNDASLTTLIPPPPLPPPQSSI
jgi:hypothetical protein